MNVKRLLFGLMFAVFVLATIHLVYLSDEVNSKFQSGDKEQAVKLGYAGVAVTVLIFTLLGVMGIVWLKFCP